MHKPLFRIAVGSVAAVGGLIAASALPAGAATAVRAETMALTVIPPAITPVTFTLTTTGVLAITAPTATVDLGSNSTTTNLPGTTIGYTGNFGPVTVTDMRASAAATWTASVSSTAFTNTSGSAYIIPVGAASYAVGTIAAATGLTTGATDVTTAKPLPLTGIAQPVVSQVAAFDGDNGATWTPTIDILVPALATVGIYTGTVTHSVA